MMSTRSDSTAGDMLSNNNKATTDRYGALEDIEDDDNSKPPARQLATPQEQQQQHHLEQPVGGADRASLAEEHDGLMSNQTNQSDEDDDGDDDEDRDIGMTIQELIYSSSSYYAIAKPVALTMILSALAVVCVNNDETRDDNEEAMADVYKVWKVNENSASNGQQLVFSLANALVIVSAICGVTFIVVLLYRLRYMKCLIGYMVLCSATLLGVLGSNLLSEFVHIYHIQVDRFSFLFFIYNFCVVGVVAVFWGQGIPKYVTQGYLIATSVVLAWHLNFFDVWTTWALLFMLAMYDLCAVLTPCGPLKALVDAMSQEDAPEMPGLLFEADLPPEAKRPGVPRTSTDRSSNRASPTSAVPPASSRDSQLGRSQSDDLAARPDSGATEGPTVKIPLAIAKVYQLPIVSVPGESMRIMQPRHGGGSSSGQRVAASPLLDETPVDDDSSLAIPDNPTPQQLRAVVVVRLPVTGGRIEEVARRGKKVYLERDRFGDPKRILWVDRSGKVFAEMRGDDEDGPERNSIRLGLGDFVFYSLLVAQAAQYSFATFCACMLVILSGLGGTLVLLSVYHQALPALPISICLGIVFYLLVRFLVEPWIETVLNKPFYV